MRRYVLTGGHGCGKTSILLALEERGERVIREAASDVQRLERSRGRTFPTDDINFESQVLQLHLQRERAADFWKVRRVFFDRGAHDHLVYASLFGWQIEPKDRIEAERRSYDAVFLVEPFSEAWAAQVGRADVRATAVLASALRETYSRLGIPVHIVSDGSVDERAQRVLDLADGFENATAMGR